MELKYNCQTSIKIVCIKPIPNKDNDGIRLFGIYDLKHCESIKEYHFYLKGKKVGWISDYNEPKIWEYFSKIDEPCEK